LILPKAWIRERQRDYYYRKAKEEKYRSRAAYKLLEVAKKYNFIKSGSIVVDLGAAPGGWMQAARKIVGEKGFVLGVDLKFIEPFDFSNVQTLISDITDPQVTKVIRKILPNRADAVISDVSPNISGVWGLDHARQIDLARHSLMIAVKILKVGGSFFVKVFHGDLLEDFVKEVKHHFDFVKLIKPKASRVRSAEIFILGMRKKKAKRRRTAK
jgi:23S rRNA (uridine2552-2'-O)-methyltransferase